MPPSSPPSRLAAFWSRRRNLFWTLHSFWALATGIVVIYLARERYGFVPWVVLFLALTWASTFFFSRRTSTVKVSEAMEKEAKAPPLGEEVASYLTRTMYQETLFFLIPFYAFSTVLASPNVVFTGILCALALFSCFDLAFDRWLRAHPSFGLVFFASVAFAALNLLLPIVLPVGPDLSTLLATGIAVVSAVPLALGSSHRTWKGKTASAVAAVVILAVGLGVPELVPPVPLRLQSATFSADIDRSTLEPLGAVPSSGRSDASAPDDAFSGAVTLLVQVFAPSNTATTVHLEWTRDGEEIRRSRDIEIVAHATGFRVWDRWRPESGIVPPGDYRVTFFTAADRVFGQARLEIH